MSDFTILWTHEAEDWIQNQRESGKEFGIPFNERVIHTPSDEEKSAIETELYNLSEIIKKFAKELIKLDMNKNYCGYMRIWFGGSLGFYVEFWYEPGYEATYFIIRNDEKDDETARIIFEDIPSIDYSSTYDYS